MNLASSLHIELIDTSELHFYLTAIRKLNLNTIYKYPYTNVDAAYLYHLSIYYLYTITHIYHVYIIISEYVFLKISIKL